MRNLLLVALALSVTACAGGAPSSPEDIVPAATDSQPQRPDGSRSAKPAAPATDLPHATFVEVSATGLKLEAAKLTSSRSLEWIALVKNTSSAPICELSASARFLNADGKELGAVRSKQFDANTFRDAEGRLLYCVPPGGTAGLIAAGKGKLAHAEVARVELSFESKSFQDPKPAEILDVWAKLYNAGHAGSLVHGEIFTIEPVAYIRVSTYHLSATGHILGNGSAEDFSGRREAGETYEFVASEVDMASSRALTFAAVGRPDFNRK
jgi:hypothetical protein